MKIDLVFFWSRLCRWARWAILVLLFSSRYTCPVLWSVPVVNMGWKNSVLWQGTVLSMVSGNQERNRRGLQRVPVVGVQQVALGLTSETNFQVSCLSLVPSSKIHYLRIIALME